MDRFAILVSLKAQLEALLLQIQNLKKILMPRKQHLYDTAVSLIGLDASPNDLAPDEYGCAESVSDVIRTAFPLINFPTLLSTRMLCARLETSADFEEMAEPLYGDIIISVTGSGNGSVLNGHTGVVGHHGIMSNSSQTGTWEQNYTLDAWNRHYALKGGMRTRFFRIVE